MKQVVLAGWSGGEPAACAHAGAGTATSRIRLSYPPIEFCTDNAAMIASAAFFHLCQGEQHELDLDVHPGLSLPFKRVRSEQERMAKQKAYALGIDLGGTKTLAAVIDITNGEVIASARKRTRAERGQDFVSQRTIELATAATQCREFAGWIANCGHWRGRGGPD